MKNKRNAFIALLLVFSTLAGCAKDIPEPVTNADYFDQKMEQLAITLANNDIKRISKAAVLDFKNSDGRTSQLGRYLSTKFTDIIIRHQLYTIPSFGEVDSAIKSEGIKYNGTLDKESAMKLGKALNVEGLIVGVISDLQKGSDIDLIVSIIEVKSGNIISSANINLLRSKSVSTMLDNTL